MTALTIISATGLFIVSIASFCISVFSFQEKGFLWNNAYFWASKQEREHMDKKPHYRQSAIVFLLVGILFFLLALDVLANITYMRYIVFLIAITTVLYALVSSIMDGTQK